MFCGEGRLKLACSAPRPGPLLVALHLSRICFGTPRLPSSPLYYAPLRLVRSASVCPSAHLCTPSPCLLASSCPLLPSAPLRSTPFPAMRAHSITPPLPPPQTGALPTVGVSSASGASSACSQSPHSSPTPEGSCRASPASSTRGGDGPRLPALRLPWAPTFARVSLVGRVPVTGPRTMTDVGQELHRSMWPRAQMCAQTRV